MPMSVSRFNAQLGRMGQSMTWARSSFCPCVSDDGSPRVDCPVCKGRGAFWAAPAACRAGVSGMKVQREWAAYGQFESGDVVISVGSDTPLYAAGELDRVAFVQSSEAFDNLRVHGDHKETPIYRILSVDRCFWLTSDGGSIIEGGLPEQNPDLTLVWPAGQLEPPAGTRYTLRGRRTPEYFIFRDFALDRAHYGGLALPRRVVLRKLDLFLR